MRIEMRMKCYLVIGNSAISNWQQAIGYWQKAMEKRQLVEVSTDNTTHF